LPFFGPSVQSDEAQTSSAAWDSLQELFRKAKPNLRSRHPAPLSQDSPPKKEENRDGLLLEA